MMLILVQHYAVCTSSKVHRLITMHAPPKQTVLTNRQTTIQGHLRSSVVVLIDAAYMPSYQHSLNLTSIFNRSSDITLSLHVNTPPLFQVNWEKTAGSIGGHALVSGCPEHCTILPHTEIPAVHRMITIHDRSRWIDGRTDRRTLWQQRVDSF